MNISKIIQDIKPIIELTNELAYLQNESGTINKEDEPKGIKILAKITGFFKSEVRKNISPVYCQALISDIADWVKAGLENPPDFGRSRDSIKLPENGCLFYFFGPLRLANGNRNGWKFETFLSLRDEPNTLQYKDMYSKYPHPKCICQSSHLLAGSRGLMESNNIVFFPENIQACESVDRQQYAVFFFNKFYLTYNSISIPVANSIIDNSFVKNETNGNVVNNYEARCVWGYLHDFFHHIGPRPFDENIEIKTKWYTGLLEEVKVDLQTLFACLQDETIPHRLEVAEFILLDRMFRYPTEKNWSKNFDSGTGLLMLSWFIQENAIKITEAKQLVIDLDQIIVASNKMVCEIEEIELLEDQEYSAKAKQFVAMHLKVDRGDKKTYFGFDFEKIGGNVFEKFHGIAGSVRYEVEELLQPVLARHESMFSS
ncbi:DUF6421 family protein [Spartinivicinus poritis]|uniref:DUF6421 family protein n=1 Tax=Spartinivicinus poritis TaxID=2994640 RepID=A0ABT5UBN1_9GAMM|nr:DUF6421 family protein [Spartinivicinus sp. A2-2]MDE1462524.1 DUF6421 family protein [Spartinivicinus sp. A2-2]